MKKAFSLSFLLLFVFVGYSQSNYTYGEPYFMLVSRAVKLSYAKDHRGAALTYDSAFEIENGKGRPTDLYDAACNWALAGETDSAFLYLNRAARDGKWSDVDETSKDKDLVSLHNDKRWSDILDRMKANLLQKENRFDKALEDTLNKVYTDDQDPRLAIDSIQTKYGQNSRQMDSLWNVIGYHDSINLKIVDRVLRRRGWPGPDEVGGRASMAVFLVIQHSDSATQVTWLPAMRDAVKQGKARPEDLALLEDRVLCEQGKPQLYGSQVKMGPDGKPVFFPIMDEVNVNKRRAAVGLGPLEEYAHYFGIDYHLPAH